MKKIFIPIFVLVASLFLYIENGQPGTTDISFETLSPEPQHRQVSQLVSKLLTNSHYRKKSLNDSLSAEIFENFIEKLDHNKLYFLASDIRSFDKHRLMFDDYIGSGQVEATYEIFNVYQQRIAERLTYVFERIEKPFDFSIDEYVVIDREDAPWATTSEELNELWRKRLKHQALSLKLAGKDSIGIIETLTKRYERVQRNISQYQSEDVFELLMNSFSESFDPHTNYFSPKNYDNFKIQMSQSLEGIGARLSTEKEYTKVVEIVAGGPADKSNQLHPNDKIIGVGQGRKGEIVDVIGWRIDDVVQLIRGKKGTVVRLQILEAEARPGALPDTISIVRDKIKLEDRSARSDTVQIEHQGKNYTFGLIDIPAFYSDYEGRRQGYRDYKSTTRDVRRLLEELKQQSVDGVIVDLRGNGGGFLNEAVDLAGLFIDEGPVVQVRNTTGKIDTERDTDPVQAYDGPLVVLVDRMSASASEIFSAAIQDYNRGIVIGSQTFGKGTVQRPVDLNRFLRRSTNKLGRLKLTVAKFYRINGGSTQHTGVVPDITFPSRFNLMDIGESSQENALLWDKIDSVRHDDYRSLAKIIPDLREQHSLRMANNEEYTQLMEKLDEFEERHDRKKISLMESKRREEREENREDGGDTSDISENEDDTTEVDSDQKEKKGLKKDLLIKESAHVLGDYVMLLSQR